MKTDIKRKPLQRTKAPGTVWMENREKKDRERREEARKQAGKPLRWVNTHQSKLRAEKCRRDFAYFISYFWDTVSHDKLLWNWHIDVFCDELQAVAQRVAEGKPKKYDLIVNVPPGTSKSVCFNVMFPTWCWINWHWMKFITASYSSPLSLDKAELQREVMRSQKFKNLFPDLYLRKDKSAKSNFQLMRQRTKRRQEFGGNRFSTSVGGTLLGFHGHINIVDDPLDPNRALHDTEIERANHWFDQTLSMRKVDKRVTPLILIMQRLHQCLLPDTVVDTTYDGPKPIKDIEVGESVRTSHGPQMVQETDNRPYAGDIVKIRTYGHFNEFWCTEDHKVMTMDGWKEAGNIEVGDDLWFPTKVEDKYSDSELIDLFPSEPDKKSPTDQPNKNKVKPANVPESELKELVDKGWSSQKIAEYFGYKHRNTIDCYISYYGLRKPSVKNKVDSDIIKDERFWRFVGYWLAEGSLSNGRKDTPYSFRLTFGSHEHELIADVHDLLGEYGLPVSCKETDRSTANVFCACYQIAAFLSEFGEGAHGKHLPKWIDCIPERYIEQLLLGYWCGDGGRIKDQIRISSVSLKLLSDFQRILFNKGITSNIMKGSERNYESVIKSGPAEGDIVSASSQNYELRVLKRDVPWIQAGEIKSKRQHSTRNKITEYGVKVKVSEVDRQYYEGRVYDITTPCHDFLSGLVVAHNSDPSGHLLEKSGGKGVRHICLPGEIDNYRDKVNPPEMIKYYENGLLDPKRMPRDVLEDMEQDLGQYGYAGQIGQFPVPPGGGMFKIDNFSIVDEMPKSNRIVRSVRFWDKAGTSAKKNKRAAYTVGVKMHKLRSGKFLISDVKRGQWSTEYREHMIRKTAEADGVNVEQGLEEEGGSGGPESADATIKNLAGFKAFKVKANKSEGSKIQRADRYSVQVNNGNVMLLRGEWNHDFIEEYRFFPYGTFADQVDAGASAFNSLAGKKVARTLG